MNEAFLGAALLDAPFILSRTARGQRLWTLWAAENTYQDHDRDSIARGKLGDFGVLSGDPRQMAASDHFKLKVDATILGGKVVFEA